MFAGGYFRVEREIVAPSLTVQLRKSVWDIACEHQFLMHSYTLMTSLSGVGFDVKIQGGHGSSDYFQGPGRIHFLPNGISLTVRPQDKGEITHLGCVFAPDFAHRVGLVRATEEGWSGADQLQAQSLKAMLRLVVNELKSPSLSSQLMIDGLGTAIAVELTRAMDQRNQSHFVKGGLAGWQLRRIRERIVESHKLPSLAELAVACGVSERHLMRMFKQSTGTTISKFSEEIRLERAKRYLRSGMPVKQVSDELGFSNVSNFSVAFKRAALVPPSQFQRECGVENI